MYDLVGFSRSQSNGFLILLPILFIILFSQPLTRILSRPVVGTPDTDLRKLDSLIALWPLSDTTSSQKAYHPFNPNTASTAELLELGFLVSVSKRIVAYRSKGGQFRRKTDILKIHGVDSAHYRDLEPFIQLPDDVPRVGLRRNTPPQNQKVAQPRFDLNKADTTQLQAINGIGQRLALRILKYREALGGFIDPIQLYEVYKLDSVVVKRLIYSSFIEPDFQPRRLNINSASKTDLAAHPYLTHKMADVIVAYRFQHGNFSSVDDLRQLPAFDSTTRAKVQRYLIVKE